MTRRSPSALASEMKKPTNFSSLNSLHIGILGNPFPLSEKIKSQIFRERPFLLRHRPKVLYCLSFTSKWLVATPSLKSRGPKHAKASKVDQNL